MNIHRPDVNCKEERMNVMFQTHKLNNQVKHQTKHALIGSKVTDIFQYKQIFITNSYIVVLY